MIGKHLSHYHITAELGRGGMGIVYKALDTKLNRTVAVKVLPIASLGSSDDKARFFREAQAAAQVHHPNIATVFAIEESALDGETEQPFIAMEYIEGETLTETIKEGPLKLDDVVEISLQVASALEAAHEKNIVHRDVKSGNVMLTKKGIAKVLDFGLAKTAASTKLTKLGSTLGTIAYMSPEQARGEEVDKRSDIWSLGVLIYEMVSGRLPYASEYEQAAVYSILNEDPEPLTSLRTGVPMGLEWLVGKCLAKNVDLRYQNISDLIVDLKALDLRNNTLSRARTTTILAAEETPQQSAATAAASRSASPINAKSISILVAVAALSALVTFLLKPGRDTGAPAPPLVLPIEIHSTGNEWSDFAGFDISPDGSSIVYSTKGTDDVNLYLMHLGQTERVKLEGTSRATYPQFDATGQFIVFTRNRGLSRIPVTGGFPEPILPSGTINGQPGYSVSSSGDVLYLPQWGEGIWMRPATGGEPVEVVAPDLESGEGGFSSPSMLPGGKTILAVRWGPGFNFDIIGIDIESKVRIPIVSGGVSPQYVEPGYLLYAQGDRLLAAAFDPETLELGTPVPVVTDGLYTNIEMQRAFFAVSESGSIVYQAGGSEWDEDLILQGFGGESRTILDADGVINVFRLSPDGEKLAYSMFTPRRDSDIFVKILGTNENIQLTRSNAYDGFPVWHPGSEYLYYSHQPGGLYRIFGTNIVEAATTDTVSIDGVEPVPYAVLSDGRLIVRTRQKQLDLFIADPRDDSAMLAPLAVSDDSEDQADLSPNGRYVVYSLSGQGGAYIYARSVDGNGARVLVAQVTGGLPRWSPSGRQVYYLDKGDLWKREHLGNLEFGKTEIVLKDISSYDIWPDESGILTFSTSDSREAFIEFDFINRLKDVVSPIK